MAGQHQAESKDKSHRVTVGSANDKKNRATAFVSQQDDKGNKTTTVYDRNNKVVKEVTKSKK